MGCGAAVLCILLLCYAETAAFAWDEGFHLLAAQLVRNGKRLYLDFFFPQTPLNTYWNAGWMLLFGDTWRTAHAAAALCTGLAAYLLAQYVRARSGTLAAVCCLVIFGLNELVVLFGGIGQAYGFCLLALVCAFRCAVMARDSDSARYAAATGFFAGLAVGASLLTAPAAVVFFIYASRRLKTAGAFLAAAALPFLPVFIASWQAPHEVLFQIFQYNFTFRTAAWPQDKLIANDLSVYKSFFRSPDALSLTILGVAGFLRSRRNPDAALCLSLAVTMSLYIAIARPTFSRYFIFVVPFLTVLAISSLPRVAPLALSAVTALSLIYTLYATRESYGWSQVEQIAKQVNTVTPPGAPILADEMVYFTSRRTPPSSLEHQNSHKPLKLAPLFLTSLHIIPQPELDRLTKAGTFLTVASCEDEEKDIALGLPTRYRHNAEAGECTVYWDLVRGR